MILPEITRVPRLRSIVLIALFLADSTPGAAQPRGDQILLDAVYASRLLWRGVPRVSNPVSQAAGTVALEMLGGHVSAGFWALVEVHHPEPGEFSIAGSDLRLAEVDYTLQYAGRRGRFDLVAGVSHYGLRNNVPIGSLQPSFRTTELYAAASLREGLLRAIGVTPSIRAWLDVDEVDGTYAEFDLTYAMPAVPLEKPLGVIHLSVRTGLSLGQSTVNGSTGYFDEDGFTHIETSAVVTGQLLPWLGLGFNWRLSFGLDPATQRGDPRSSATNRSSWGWIETWVTVRLPGRSW
jgi:hypothetical protein